ncbi:MAG: pre-peptidase C-terminal domain-containing protein [Candidatus Binatia bacterium]
MRSSEDGRRQGGTGAASAALVTGAMLVALLLPGAAGAAAYSFPRTKQHLTAQRRAPSGPNPLLAFLPAGAQPDYAAWRAWMASQGVKKRSTLPPTNPLQLILAAETEPNGTQGTADAVSGFGTGLGDDDAADLSGTIAPSAPLLGSPSVEDDGSIPLAAGLAVPSGTSIKVSQTLGDGPHGSGGTGSGDFDFFAVALAAGDELTVDIDADVNGSPLDSFVVIWNSAGGVLVFNDDYLDLDSYIAFTAPAAGTYYVSVGAYLNPAPIDPFDSSSGTGFTSQGPYDVTIGVNAGDSDFFAIALDAGDVIAANILGGADEIRLYDPATLQRIGSQQDIGFIVPGPFPTGGNASFAYVAETAGTYAVRVSGGSGAYTLELRAFRPYLEGQPGGAVQTLFIDFNGATVNPAIFGEPSGSAVLSPLSTFLPGWGLGPASESAVIDAILDAVEESLSTDMRVLGLNGDFDVSNTPGDFDVVILNSRDHADPFGNPNVSRVIVGGTIGELGIGTIGIAQSIDIGNFATSESAVVLLDLLSAPASDPNSLNQFGLAGGKTIIDLVGVGVGNIVAHEAGHILANFHTDNSDGVPNIMDQGGNLPNTVGVGGDLIFGSFDDADVDFALAVYDPDEGFSGREDALNAVAFGLSTSAAAGICGDGTLNLGEDCDDGNVLNGDCCTSTCGMPVCTVTAFGKGGLLSKETAGKEKLVAKFLKGPALTQTDFGDPFGGTTAYHLCVWDDGPALVGGYRVDRAGDVCSGASALCWKPLGQPPPSGAGYAFKDSDAVSDGIAKMSLKGGGAGKSKVLVKGRGAALPSIATALQTSTSVTLQLVGSDAPVCLQKTLSNITKQEAGFFKAK